MSTTIVGSAKLNRNSNFGRGISDMYIRVKVILIEWRKEQARRELLKTPWRKFHNRTANSESFASPTLCPEAAWTIRSILPRLKAEEIPYL